MRWIAPVLSLAVTVALFVGLDNPIPVGGARVPPAGRFLDPFSGFWHPPASRGVPPETIDVTGLLQPVTVVWDEHRVPHVFADNTHDLYFAQGWVTARDRLWQMEFQTFVAAGRLAEIVGPSAVEFDRFRRRIGMPHAARRSLQTVLADPVTREAVEAYSKGVNAWIRGLDTDTVPLEYKILDYHPEPWSPLKSALLLKHMAFTLTGHSRERDLSRARVVLGRETVDALYPDFPPFMEPIVPIGTTWEFDPPDLVVPAAEFPTLTGEPQEPSPADEARGSNSWAIAGSRTHSGHPILSNDPHLPLHLPSIWYEIQLTAPDHAVYGVSLPGAPAVIVGFNRDIAWGVTNAETDVLDWFLLRFRDESMDQYFHDGVWRSVEWREEVIRVRDGTDIVERIPFTHHGPVVCPPGTEPATGWVVPGAAMRWTAHDPSNELRSFLELDRATDYPGFVEALKWFDNPGQNFAFASRDGDIAVWHAGRFPVRWEGQGKFVGDGTDPSFEWQDTIPRDRLPHVLNPSDGFVSSSNQNPAGPDYPYYLAGGYAPFERAARIRELLGTVTDVLPEDVIAMQNDVVGLHARTLLPALLSALEAAEPGEEFDGAARHALGELHRWDHRYDATAVAPLIFDRWQREFAAAIWDDDMETPDGRLPRPRRDVTAALVTSGGISPYADDPDTDERETVAEIAVRSFRSAVESLVELHGPPGEHWAWGEVRRTHIRHLSRIPGLGRNGLRTSGQYGLIRATTGSRGQSWRMVVDLSPDVRAWGVLPGGQSGDPGSVFYDDQIEDWQAGVLRPLLILGSADEQSPSLAGRTVLRGGS